MVTKKNGKGTAHRNANAHGRKASGLEIGATYLVRFDSGNEVIDTIEDIYNNVIHVMWVDSYDRDCFVPGECGTLHVDQAHLFVSKLAPAPKGRFRSAKKSPEKTITETTITPWADVKPGDVVHSSNPNLSETLIQDGYIVDGWWINGNDADSYLGYKLLDGHGWPAGEVIDNVSIPDKREPERTKFVDALGRTVVNTGPNVDVDRTQGWVSLTGWYEAPYVTIPSENFQQLNQELAFEVDADWQPGDPFPTENLPDAVNMEPEPWKGPQGLAAFATVDISDARMDELAERVGAYEECLGVCVKRAERLDERMDSWTYIANDNRRRRNDEIADITNRLTALETAQKTQAPQEPAAPPAPEKPRLMVCPRYATCKDASCHGKRIHEEGGACSISLGCPRCVEVTVHTEGKEASQ